MGDGSAGAVRPVRLEDLGEALRRYRLPDAASEAVMTRSLERYGQMAPIVGSRKKPFGLLISLKGHTIRTHGNSLPVSGVTARR